jgi:hypothetical protein
MKSVGMSLTNDIITVLQEDLGPSAAIFLERCCKKSLGKRSADITREDIRPLAECSYNGIMQSLGQQVAEKVKLNLLALQ